MTGNTTDTSIEHGRHVNLWGIAPPLPAAVGLRVVRVGRDYVVDAVDADMVDVVTDEAGNLSELYYVAPSAPAAEFQKFVKDRRAELVRGFDVLGELGLDADRVDPWCKCAELVRDLADLLEQTLKVLGAASHDDSPHASVTGTPEGTAAAWSTSPDSAASLGEVPC